MGKKADLRPKQKGIPNYETKLRLPGDRVDRNGDRVEGGKIFSRHFYAVNEKSAKKVAQKLAKRLDSRVVSVKRIHPEDIIGDFRTWDLKDIIGGLRLERRKDVILDNVTLDEIVLKKK